MARIEYSAYLISYETNKYIFFSGFAIGRQLGRLFQLDTYYTNDMWEGISNMMHCDSNLPISLLTSYMNGNTCTHIPSFPSISFREGRIICGITSVLYKSLPPTFSFLLI